MKDLVLKNSGQYFGIRNRILNITTVVSMFIAGLILTFFTDGLTLIGFFIIAVQRPDLIKHSLYGGIIFGLSYFLAVIIFNIILGDKM